jgi:hypothetical protein
MRIASLGRPEQHRGGDLVQVGLARHGLQAASARVRREGPVPCFPRVSASRKRTRKASSRLRDCAVGDRGTLAIKRRVRATLSALDSSKRLWVPEAGDSASGTAEGGALARGRGSSADAQEKEAAA